LSVLKLRREVKPLNEDQEGRRAILLLVNMMALKDKDLLDTDVWCADSWMCSFEANDMPCMEICNAYSTTEMTFNGGEVKGRAAWQRKFNRRGGLVPTAFVPITPCSP
jgi:hypothetical protein